MSTALFRRWERALSVQLATHEAFLNARRDVNRLDVAWAMCVLACADGRATGEDAARARVALLTAKRRVELLGRRLARVELIARARQYAYMEARR